MTDKEEACLIVARDAVATTKQNGRAPSSWIVKLQSGKTVMVDTDEVICYLLDKILEKSMKEIKQ